jgi:hypothetical protein
MTAKFLNDHDKLLAVERLRANQMGIVSTEWDNKHVYDALLDPKTWFWFALIFSISIPSGGVTTFGPLIVSSFGFNPFNTILLNIPFGAVQIFATLGAAWFATYTKRKGPALAMLCIPPIIGCVMLLTITHTVSHRGPLLVGYYLISFYPGITPLIYSWSSQNTAGETKKKTTTAIIFIGQSAGNILGPHLYTTGEAPRYVRGLVSKYALFYCHFSTPSTLLRPSLLTSICSLVLFIVLIVLTISVTLYLMLLNKRHATRREALGKSGVVIDRSMMNFEERQASDDASGSDYPDRALNDETDTANEDFIYVY